MNASTVVQLLILFDQIAAKVVELVQSAGDLSASDEEALRKLVEEHRDKNNVLFDDVLARLKKRAEG